MQTDLRAWTVKDSLELYNVTGWGRDFFTINDAGDIAVTPAGPGSLPIDLKLLVDDLRSRGLNQTKTPRPRATRPTTNRNHGTDAGHGAFFLRSDEQQLRAVGHLDEIGGADDAFDVVTKVVLREVVHVGRHPACP